MTRPAAAQRGFTLIEVMVTLSVIALLLQMVYANLGAAVPATKLDADAKKLVSNMDYMRSEARLQGKRYKIQLDLEQDRWRFVLPAEERLTTDQTLEDVAPQALDWSPLEEGVRILGAGSMADGIVRTQVYTILFDENGFTADQSVFFGLVEDEKMVWTVQLNGLTGRSEIITDYNGVEYPIELPNEAAF